MRNVLVAPALLVALVLAGPLSARSTPLQFVPVGDPIEAELRILDLYEPSPAGDALRLVHLGSRPLQVVEILGPPRGAIGGARGIAFARIARGLWRDSGADSSGGGPAGATPRLLQRAWAGDERVEVSAGVEGEWEWTRLGGVDDERWLDGSGVHVRTAIQVDRWLAYSHAFFGELRGVRAFSDALVSGTDVAASTEESYLAYTAGRQWSAQLGRSRWHWGPGNEGSLLLSRTSAPLNGLMFHARLEGLHADAFLFDATVEPGRGEQLAAHRLEWQPRDWARLGVSEAARYHAGGWQGVYLAGVIPYSVAQRLLDQDHRDSTGALRNNVMVSLDASLRVADGSRIYGELLLDDVHARTASVPNKYGWQLGWDGAGDVRGTRVTWNAEYTWLSRYVYTSFFGRAFTAQDRPLGFPTGPDARRLRLTIDWDPRAAWQVSAIATRTDKGENDLAEPFVPGSPVPDVATLEGVVERSRGLEGAVRWWPASGVDVSLRAGRTWIDDAAHVAGASTAAWRGSLALRLVR